MHDCLIIGGGVIGLSLAYELASHRLRVLVLDRGQPGHEASWAGAGILPPGNRATAANAYDQLVGLSHELHPIWAQALSEETGIDNGFRRTGSIHVARDADQAALLREAAQLWRNGGLAVEELSNKELAAREPALADSQVLSQVRAAALLPDEAQVRNPRHLKALLVACRQRGVAVEANVAVEGFQVRAGRVEAIETQSGTRTAGAICLCGGAWTGHLGARLGAPLPMVPVRGQIVLLAAASPPLRHILNEGRRYFVPRPDGRVLIGATEEKVGFDSRATADGVAGLLDFGLGLVPALRAATVERAWAGLRPGTPDGLPYLGRLGELENAFVAAGHFRGGLHQSPATAQLMSQVIRGQQPEIELFDFRPHRHAGHEHAHERLA
ncbi:MAG: glycine oxidase ThiO [Pirellulales bacterium]|nr:glycine oxidase ThiO [Pirellulales bacterium]